MYICNGDNKSGSVIYRECTKRRNASCLARLHTKCRLDNFEIVKQINGHNHSSSKSDVAVKEAICNLKETAKNNKFEPARSLVGDCLPTIDSTSKVEITNVKHLSRSVRKWKAEDRHHPEIPTTATDFDISLNFSTTNSGDKFLQFDSGREDQNRILICATNEGLNDIKPTKIGHLMAPSIILLTYFINYLQSIYKY